MKKVAIIFLIILVIGLIGFIVYNIYPINLLDKDNENSNLNTENSTKVAPVVVNNNVNKVTAEKDKNENNKKEMVNAYKNIVNSYSEKMENKIYCLYNILDIDVDGMPELIIKDGDSEATTKYFIYTYKNNDVKLLDTIDGGNSVLFYSESGKYLILENAHMGYETVTNISKENDKLSKNVVISDKDVGTGEYDHFDNEIQMTECNDLSLINNFGI